MKLIRTIRFMVCFFFAWAIFAGAAPLKAWADTPSKKLNRDWIIAAFGGTLPAELMEMIAKNLSERELALLWKIELTDEDLATDTQENVQYFRMWLNAYWESHVYHVRLTPHDEIFGSPENQIQWIATHPFYQVDFGARNPHFSLQELTRYMSQLLRTSTTLQTLSLSNQYLGPILMNDITESVLHSTVENLNLAWNILGNQGATSLSQIIQRSSTLKSLNLSRNEIGDSGLQDIAQALAKNTTLKSLNLEGNQITSAGVKLLADALRYNTTLEFLDLRRNDISDSSTPEWIELDRTFACFGPDLKRREPQLDTNLPLSARIAQSLDRFFRTYSFFSSMKASE